MKKHHYKIAVIAGDGIGKEVMPEAIRVLEKIAKRYNISFDFDHKDWSCERYHQFGSMMLEHLGQKDASNDIINAFKTVIKEGKALTPDMDGKSSTAELGEAILDKL